MAVSRRTAFANYRLSLLDALSSRLDTLVESEGFISFSILLVECQCETGALTCSLNTSFDYHRKRVWFEENQRCIDDLKYQSDYFHYQAFLTLQPIEESLFQLHFQNKLQLFKKNCELYLQEFMETESFKAIPKEEGFQFVLMFSDESNPHVIRSVFD